MLLPSNLLLPAKNDLKSSIFPSLLIKIKLLHINPNNEHFSFYQKKPPDLIRRLHSSFQLICPFSKHLWFCLRNIIHIPIFQFPKQSHACDILRFYKADKRSIRCHSMELVDKHRECLKRISTPVISIGKRIPEFNRVRPWFDNNLADCFIRFL